MATETPNLHLEKPAENEFYDVKKFNANWDKIDAAVKSLSSAEEYSSAKTYALGDYCTNDGKLYRCTTAITEAEAWTEAHWTETSVTDELKAIYMTLQNKQDASTAINTGNISQQTVDKACYAVDNEDYTAKLRNQGLTPTEITPSINGRIQWQYG